MRFSAMIIALVFSAVSVVAEAEDTERTGSENPRSIEGQADVCRELAAELPKNSTAQERWAWGELCHGRVADMRYVGENRSNAGCQPTRTTAGWEEYRQLSAKFIRRILSEEPWLSGLPDQAVVIRCASVQERLDLRSIQSSRGLVMARNWFRSGVDISEARFTQELIFDDSNFSSIDEDNSIDLDARRLNSRSSVSMRSAHFGRIQLRDARLAGDFRFDWAVATGGIFAQGLRIGGSLSGIEAELIGINLRSSVVAGNVDLDHLTLQALRGPLRNAEAAVAGGLFAKGMRVDGDVSTVGATADSFELMGARVEGDLVLSQSKIDYSIDGRGIIVGGDVFLEEIETGFLRFQDARVGRSLDLLKSNISAETDFTNIDIEYNLLLSQGEAHPRWGRTAVFKLRDATVGRLVADMPGSWTRLAGGGALPTDLTGFTYGGLYETGFAFSDNAEGDTRARRLIEWIEGPEPGESHDAAYRPEPYIQLAKVMRATGSGADANEVESAMHAHRMSTYKDGISARADLSMDWFYKITLGFGLAPHRLLFWFGGLGPVDIQGSQAD